MAAPSTGTTPHRIVRIAAAMNAATAWPMVVPSGAAMTSTAPASDQAVTIGMR